MTIRCSFEKVKTDIFHANLPNCQMCQFLFRIFPLSFSFSVAFVFAFVFVLCSYTYWFNIIWIEIVKQFDKKDNAFIIDKHSCANI